MGADAQGGPGVPGIPLLPDVHGNPLGLPGTIYCLDYIYYLKRGVINFLLTCLSYPSWSIIIMLYRWLGRVENRLSIVFTLFKTAILTAFLCKGLLV